MINALDTNVSNCIVQARIEICVSRPKMPSERCTVDV